MKKTVIALAALAASGAFAQSSVTLSGRANLGYSSWQATGSTQGAAADSASRARIHDASSRITFAAMEDLGGGLRAGVYCETGINIDTGSTAGQDNLNNSNTSEWCTREGRVYFGNNLAEIRLGRQNVWWTQGIFNDSGSNHIGTDSISNMFNGGTGGTITRGNNMVMLHANSGAGGFAGSNVYIGYSNNAAGEAQGVANTLATYGLSGFKINYVQGSLAAGLDYQSQSNTLSSSTANSFDQSAWRLSAGYLYGTGGKVSLQYWAKERTDKTTPTASFANKFGSTTAVTVGATAGSGKDSGWALNLVHPVSSAVTLFGQYARANNITGTTSGEIADSGASSYTLGATYRFSKRTHLYGVYSQYANQANATYNSGGGQWNSNTAFAGSLVSTMGVGIQHDF